MSTEHYIIRCKLCNVTISQCRCMFGDKVVKEGICSKCKDAIEKTNTVYKYDKGEQ